MICLKNGRSGYGQADRDLRTVQRARDREKRTAALANATAAYETQMTKARPMPISHHRAADYPTAVRAAIRAWDKEMRDL